MQDFLAVMFREVHVKNKQVDPGLFRISVDAFEQSQGLFAVAQDLQHAIYVEHLEGFPHEGHICRIVFGYKNLERLLHTSSL